MKMDARKSIARVKTADTRRREKGWKGIGVVVGNLTFRRRNTLSHFAPRWEMKIAIKNEAKGFAFFVIPSYLRTPFAN